MHTIAPTSAPVPSTTATAAPSEPRFRGPARSDLALLDHHGVGFFRVRDTLTGYGRPEGYDSLPNARRAAYMLSRGTDRAAAGIFQQGDRYFVRALGALPGRSPHEGGAGAATDDAMRGAMQLLHFEGNAEAHFAWVRDARLVLMVDGATKIWSRDAHHQPPSA
jgi:hypothetical protein